MAPRFTSSIQDEDGKALDTTTYSFTTIATVEEASPRLYVFRTSTTYPGDFASGQDNVREYADSLCALDERFEDNGSTTRTFRAIMATAANDNVSSMPDNYSLGTGEVWSYDNLTKFADNISFILGGGAWDDGSVIAEMPPTWSGVSGDTNCTSVSQTLNCNFWTDTGGEGSAFMYEFEHLAGICDGVVASCSAPLSLLCVAIE